MVDPNNIKIETAFDKFVSDHYYGRWSNLIKAISQHYNMDTKPVLQDVMRHWKKPRKRKSYAYHMVEKYMREVHDVEIDNLIAIRADATADRQTELPIGPKNDTDDMLERISRHGGDAEDAVRQKSKLTESKRRERVERVLHVIKSTLLPSLFLH